MASSVGAPKRRRSKSALEIPVHVGKGSISGWLAGSRPQHTQALEGQQQELTLSQPARASSEAIAGTVTDDDVRIHPSWTDIIANEMRKAEGQKLQAFLASARLSSTVYPPQDEVFTALLLTPLDKVSVCILGQDPYHG